MIFGNKSTNFEIFPILIQRVTHFFSIFKIFRFFFEKWPQGVLGNVKRNNVMKYELISSIPQCIMQDHLHVRVDCTPPCSIGLKNILRREKIAEQD